jgi:hypothetical protein
MIELSQVVLAVMAGETGSSKILVVLEHKGGVLLGMAGVAARHIGNEARTLGIMAGGAGHGGQVIVELVVGQAEIGCAVVEKRQGR